MRGITSILKTKGLLHVDIFGQKTVEKSIAHINLLKAPPAGDSEREDQMNRGRLHHGAESISIVDPLLLSKTTSNKASFVLVNRTILTMLGLKDPLAAHNINTRRPRHQHPCVRVTKGSKFRRHGGTPSRFTKSITMRSGCGKECMPTSVVPHRAIRVCLGLTRMITVTSDHSVPGSHIIGRWWRQGRRPDQWCHG